MNSDFIWLRRLNQGSGYGFAALIIGLMLIALTRPALAYSPASADDAAASLASIAQTSEEATFGDGYILTDSGGIQSRNSGLHQLRFNRHQVNKANVFTMPADNGPNIILLSSTNPQTTTTRVLNEVKLIDTFVEWLAWGWICLGIGAILLLLIIFPLLQIRGSHLKRQQKD